MPDAAQWSATTLLYPTRGLYIASDRARNADGSPFVSPSDIVYPAITKNTDYLVAGEEPGADRGGFYPTGMNGDFTGLI